MAKYECDRCGYVYDSLKGDPENGIEAGTSFEDLPEDWECPDCGAPKEEFSQRQRGVTMQYAIHRADERGIGEHGWLHSRFSFSFAEYHNPNRMNFGVLRVINDDIIDPQSGFGTHPHHDMEIITIVLKGVIEHRDSLGHHGFTKAGEIQIMSAGTGIEHSEHNPSKEESLELLQIWIFPNAYHLSPRYEKVDFSNMSASQKWALLISGDGHDGSMKISQDATIKMARLKGGSDLLCEAVQPGYGRLLFVIKGEVEILGMMLERCDELQTIQSDSFKIHAIKESHLLLFEVVMKR